MLHINIDKEIKQSLSQQICNAIKSYILQGILKPEEKLPSSRELASYLNVSRNIVIESYEQMIAEGYLYSKNGSGTYICEGLKMQRLQVSEKEDSQIIRKKQCRDIISFRTGIPDLKAIPIGKWAQMYHQICYDVKSYDMDYQDSIGDYEFRVQLSLYLNRARGTSAYPDNIIITNGAAQSFNLLCQLIPKDSYALVENPVSSGILHTLKSNNVNVQPIELDEHGMITEELPVIPPKLIFTTPSHQFPTGVILPARRRIELIKYAKHHDAYIVEDDYDSEFRFEVNPIQAMQYLDPERVIYVGTFSKTLMPALRIGYMILPKALFEQVRKAKYMNDIYSPILEQKALAKFIETGAFDHHIITMRKLYLKKRNYLIDCLRNTFGSKVRITGADAGLHFIVTFNSIVFTHNLIIELEKSGVEICTLSKYCLKSSSLNKSSLVFGYGNTKIEDMEKGVKIIYDILYCK